MKKLLINFSILISVSIATLELYSRYYYYSNNNSKISYTNIDGDLMFEPYTEGIYNEPFNTHYKINSLGFNSIKEKYELHKTKKNIALVGDSFIVGFHSDVENSIGQRIESNGFNVNEFGLEGNIRDYLLIYEKYNLDKYDKVYIFLTGNNDISYKYPNAMNYFDNFKNFTKGYLKIERFLYERIISTTYTPDIKLIKSLPNVTYVPHFNFDLKQLNGLSIKFLNIDKYLNSSDERYNFTTDSHWNDNGRKLVAEFILKDLYE